SSWTTWLVTVTRCWHACDRSKERHGVEGARGKGGRRHRCRGWHRPGGEPALGRRGGPGGPGRPRRGGGQGGGRLARRDRNPRAGGRRRRVHRGRNRGVDARRP